jgi:CRAL/TRIO, N-terminal domain
MVNTGAEIASKESQFDFLNSVDMATDFIPAGSSSSAMRDVTVLAIKANAGTWGQLGYLTPEEDLILTKFRTEVHPLYVDAAKYTCETFDQCCLRFLRARRFDTGKALILLTECNEKLIEMNAGFWAKQPADYCADCDIAALKNFYPHAQQGFDKINRPILFEHCGGICYNLHRSEAFIESCNS